MDMDRSRICRIKVFTMPRIITNIPLRRHRACYSKSLGIVENASVYKVMTHRLGGPVLIKVDSSDIALGKDIAERIMVRR